MKFIHFHKISTVCNLIFSACFMTLFAGQGAAASYDCAKARPGVEQAICLSPQLSQLDEVMASLYQTTFKNVIDKTSLRQTQRDWQRLVRNQCSTEACLVNVYQHRIDQLRSGGYGDWANDFTLNNALGAITGQPGRIGYAPTNNTDSYAKEWMATARILETAFAYASDWVRFDERLKIVAKPCGQVNAFYANRTVVVCYELATKLISDARQRVGQGENEIRERNRVALALQFAVLHELGHAAIDQIPNYPSLGREETEVDTFASIVLLNKISPEIVIDALWADYSLMLAASQYANYGDVHELGEQRYANFACLAGGRYQALLPNLVRLSAVTKERASSCGKEWARAYRGASALAKQAGLIASR